MRQIIAKIMVICLLVISVHSASGGEYAPVNDAIATSQTLSITSVITGDDNLPIDDTQMGSECGFCHAVHVLLVLAPEGFALNIYSARQFEGIALDMLPSLMDDIPHPPIILI